MTSPYNKVIQEIFNLKRVHTMLHDAGIAAILRHKLTRLNLAPALQEMQRLKQLGAFQLPASATSSSSNSNSSNSGGGGAALYGAAILQQDPLLLSPTAITHLVDCLAYFELSDAQVSRDAVRLVEGCISFLPPSQLGRTLAACCALGEQGTLVVALPLLMEALKGGPSGHKESGVHTALLRGPEVLQLMESLQREGVTQEEVWRALAQHCASILDTLDGRQCLRLVLLLHSQRLQGYPELYSAIEKYILHMQQHSEGLFLSRSQMEEVILCLKELGQPVVELQAAQQRGVEAGDILASFTPASSAAATVQSGTGSSKTTAPATEVSNLKNFMPTTPNEDFIAASLDHLAEAEGETLLDWLVRCQRRRLMHPKVMECAVQRWIALYGNSNPNKEGDDGGSSDKESVTQHRSVAERQMQFQILAVMLTFINHEFFPKTLQKQLIEAIDNDAAWLMAPAKRRVPSLLSIIEGLLTMFDTELQFGTSSASSDAPQAPNLVSFYSQSLDLIKQIKDISILLEDNKSGSGGSGNRVGTGGKGAGANRHTGGSKIAVHVLLTFTNVMVQLRRFGGEEILRSQFDTIAIAAVQSQRQRVQIEVCYLLSRIPHINQANIIPLLFQHVTSFNGTGGGGGGAAALAANNNSSGRGQGKKGAHKQGAGSLSANVRWTQSLTSLDLRRLLETMLNARIKEGEVLRGAVALLKDSPERIDLPSDLALCLNYLARLGVREPELYIAVATSLLSPSRAARHLATVHDLALLLFTFTFAFQEVIRVTQELFSRLRVGAGHATSHDISICFYSMVKLNVAVNSTGNRDLCRVLGARGSERMQEFTGGELSSSWTSLRVLKYYPADFAEATARRLETWAEEKSKQGKQGKAAGANNSTAPTLSPAEFLSIASNMMELSDKEAKRHSTPGLFPSRGKSGAEAAPAAAPLKVWRGSRKLQQVYKAYSLALLHNTIASSLQSSDDRRHVKPPQNAHAMNGVLFYWNMKTMVRLHKFSGETTTSVTGEEDRYIHLTIREWELLAHGANQFAFQLNSSANNSSNNSSSSTADHSVAAAEVLIALYDLYVDIQRNTTTGKSAETNAKLPSNAEWLPLPVNTEGENLYVKLPPNLLTVIARNLLNVSANNIIREKLIRIGVFDKLQLLSSKLNKNPNNHGVSTSAKGRGRPAGKKSNNKMEPVSTRLSAVSGNLHHRRDSMAQRGNDSSSTPTGATRRRASASSPADAISNSALSNFEKELMESLNQGRSGQTNRHNNDNNNKKNTSYSESEEGKELKEFDALMEFRLEDDDGPTENQSTSSSSVASQSSASPDDDDTAANDDSKSAPMKRAKTKIKNTTKESKKADTKSAAGKSKKMKADKPKNEHSEEGGVTKSATEFSF